MQYLMARPVLLRQHLAKAEFDNVMIATLFAIMLPEHLRAIDGQALLLWHEMREKKALARRVEVIVAHQAAQSTDNVIF